MRHAPEVGSTLATAANHRQSDPVVGRFLLSLRTQYPRSHNLESKGSSSRKKSSAFHHAPSTAGSPALWQYRIAGGDAESSEATRTFGQFGGVPVSSAESADGSGSEVDPVWCRFPVSGSVGGPGCD
jgi:hypothetical protein